MMPPTMLPLETNLLLGTLPKRSMDRLRSILRVTEYPLAERVFHAGDEPQLLFPLDGIMSLVQELEDGTMVEVAIIGAEGLAGLSGLLGVASSPQAAVTQGRGLFATCSPRRFREMFATDPSLRDVLLRWVHVAMANMAQTAVCNRLHEVDLRLAHWLLLIHDRSASDEISVTQEFLGFMLGARRATINESMRRLVGTGAIEHRRARVLIVDRRKLERASCECYAATVEQYREAFGFPPRARTRVTPVD